MWFSVKVSKSNTKEGFIMAPRRSSLVAKTSGSEPSKNTKYLFVTGGVLSGVGKGITAASLGALLKARGLSVTVMKCDQYLNVDAGTLNPAEHGECYVTTDGAETDLDLGHYERFLDQDLTYRSSLMTGRIYKKVIDKERAGGYGGKTVQIVPHVTGAVIDEMLEVGKDHDILIVEVGGTVGDIEGLHFLEAIRELEMRIGRDNYVHMHVVYMPYLGTSEEFKTKPAQHAVLELRRIGLVPDLIGARAEKDPPLKLKEKLSMFCGVPTDGIVLLPNADTVYRIPLNFEQSGIVDYITDQLKLKADKPDLAPWRALVKRATTDFDATVTIGIVAKYLDNADTYFSVTEALRSAARANSTNLKFEWVNAEEITETNVKVMLKKYDGLLVPGGFGKRGVEGKIIASQYALASGKPYLGICLGLQVAVIGVARSMGLRDANSTEVEPKTPDPIVYIMDGQQGKELSGGTMRLGSYDCIVQKGSLAHRLFKSDMISERHRHRYEVNQDYLQILQDGGLAVTGTSPDGRLVEIVEGKNHPYFIAIQSHPEFLSRPMRPHPLFDGLIKAALKS
jgi:CTP synthase